MDTTVFSTLITWTKTWSCIVSWQWRVKHTHTQSTNYLQCSYRHGNSHRASLTAMSVSLSHTNTRTHSQHWTAVTSPPAVRSCDLCGHVCWVIITSLFVCNIFSLLQVCWGRRRSLCECFSVIGWSPLSPCVSLCLSPTQQTQQGCVNTNWWFWDQEELESQHWWVCVCVLALTLFSCCKC